MADRFTVTGDGLYRTTGLVAGSSDFTVLIRFTPRSSITGADYRCVFAYINDLPGPSTAYDRFIGIFGYLDGGQQKYFLEANDGTGHKISTSFTLTNGTQYNLAYIRKGTLNIFQINDVVIDSFDADFSAISWLAACAGGDGFAITDEDLVYYREYARALTLNEVFTEFQSSKGFVSTNIVADTPLIDDIDDISGQNNHWLEIAGASTFVNNTLPTAVDIGFTFPYSRVVTQAEFNVSNLFWFKFTTAIPIAIGSFTNHGGTFTPKTFMYLSDGNTVVDSFTNDGFYRLVGPGDYYFKIVRSAGGASNFDFTTEFDITTLTVPTIIPLNSFIVNDDEAGFPGSLWQTDGTLLAFLIQIPAGELGATLPNGVTLWHDRFNNYRIGRLALINSSLQYLTTVDTTPALGAGQDACCICANGTDFYVLNISDKKLWKVTSAGVITDTGATLTGKFPTAIGVNAAGTIVYFVEGFTNPDLIQAWDITGNTDLGTIYTIVPAPAAIGVTAVNNHNGEILIIANGNIVTYYFDGTLTTWTVIQITPAGTLVSTKDFTGDFRAIDHISYNSSGNSIGIWFFFTGSDDSVGRFGILNLSTGVLTTSFDSDLFSFGENKNSGELPMFGPSASCTMLTVAAVQSGGIYKIVPGKRNDTLWVSFDPTETEDVKIPDPQAKTALLGE